MAATNTTPNLELSQFVGSDKPDWLTDYNGDMSKIDSSYGAVDALAQAANSAAEAAAASATQAAADAASALSGISGAIDAANAATAAAEQATSVSNSALSVANGAAATAQSAAADAQQALSVANNAKVTAENAQAAAAQAATDAAASASAASTAQAAATQAATDAAASAAIAQGLQTDIDGAIATANAANSTAAAANTTAGNAMTAAQAAQSDIDTVETYIPANASASNQLLTAADGHKIISAQGDGTKTYLDMLCDLVDAAIAANVMVKVLAGRAYFEFDSGNSKSFVPISYTLTHQAIFHNMYEYVYATSTARDTINGHYVEIYDTATDTRQNGHYLDMSAEGSGGGWKDRSNTVSTASMAFRLHII